MISGSNYLVNCIKVVTWDNKEMSAGSSTSRTLVSETPGSIFDVLGSDNREKVVNMVQQDGVSLGMVDPTNGR